jgi:hypothetical protein
MFSGLMGYEPLFYPVKAEKNGAICPKAYETLIKGGLSCASFGKNRFSLFDFKQKLDLPLRTILGALGPPKACAVSPYPQEMCFEMGFAFSCGRANANVAIKLMDLFCTDCTYVGTKCDKYRLALFRVHFLALCVCGSQDNSFSVCTSCFS